VIPVEPLPESSSIILPTPHAALFELSQPLPTPAGAGLLRGPPQFLSPPVPSAVLDPAFASGPVLAPGTAEGMRAKTKRQLLIPDISMLSWLNSIDPSDLSPDTDFKGLVKGMQALAKDIVRIVDALNVDGEVLKPVAKQNKTKIETPKPPFRHGPPIAVLAPFTNGTSPFNETNNPLQQAADAAGFDAALVADEKANTPPSPPLSTAAALLPYLMGPGPVVPPGVVVDWPGPNTYDDGDGDDGVSNLEDFPIVVNDIDDEEAAKEEVRKFFEELGKGAEAAGSKDNDVE
jgi:hypothetical protein